jgi:DNA-binding GntR family transcriptional regulator
MLNRQPLRDQIYQDVLSRIYRGELPPGSRVRDTAVAAQLGVSRTPVREALLRLARDGALAADMGRGFSVPALQPAEMRETGQILSALECLALELSSDITPDRLTRLSQIDGELAAVRGDVNRAVDLDEEWHRTLLAGCPNVRLRTMISNLWQVPSRYMRAYLRDAGRVALSTQHHASVVEALRRNDRTAAAQRFQHHWSRGMEELGAWIAH